MIYKIVSNESYQLTKAFQKNNIPYEGRTYPISRLESVAKRLTPDDTVICLNADKFESVTKLYDFCRTVMNIGANISFTEQPYLNFGNKYKWNDKVGMHVNMISMLENETIFKLNMDLDSHDRYKYLIYRYISDMNIQILANTYSKDGILNQESR
jgi:hypothetical protein